MLFNKKSKQNKDYLKSGYVTLMSVLVVGAAGLLITNSLIVLGLGSAKTSFALEQSNQAKGLANACIEEALQQIRDNSLFVGGNQLTLSYGLCTYNVINTGGQNRAIASVGIVDTIQRKIEVNIDTITPQINISSWQEVE